MSRVIAGIGSRDTPSNILKEMKEIGSFCKDSQIWLRSGHADGADYAFECGSKGFCIAYLPWKEFNSKFNSSRASFYVLPDKISETHLSLIQEYHPTPDKLSREAQKLIARNCYQILGRNLNSPVSAVVCWCEEHLDCMSLPKWKGETGFALRLAWNSEIPILNMYNQKWNNTEKVVSYLRKLFNL